MWKKSESETPGQSSSSPSTAMENISSFKSRIQSGNQSVIGSSICITGDISGEEDLLIEGTIEGKIVLLNNNVTIGTNGRINADIHGKTITIDGNVEGNIFGEEQIIIRQTSIVRGNIVSPRITLKDGCKFKGNIDMSPKETPTPSSIPIPAVTLDNDSDTDMI